MDNRNIDITDKHIYKCKVAVCVKEKDGDFGCRKGQKVLFTVYQLLCVWCNVLYTIEALDLISHRGLAYGYRRFRSLKYPRPGRPGGFFHASNSIEKYRNQ